MPEVFRFTAVFDAVAKFCVAVKVEVPPFSATEELEAVSVTKGEASSSLVVILTLWLESASYFVSAVLLVLIATVSVLPIEPSLIVSATPVIVTV